MKGQPHRWESRQISDVEELADLGMSDRNIAIALSYYYAIDPELTRHQVKTLRQRRGIKSSAGKNNDINFARRMAAA